jgi:hypothetical protein
MHHPVILHVPVPSASPFSRTNQVDSAVHAVMAAAAAKDDRNTADAAPGSSSSSSRRSRRSSSSSHHLYHGAPDSASHAYAAAHGAHGQPKPRPMLTWTVRRSTNTCSDDFLYVMWLTR